MTDNGTGGVRYAAGLRNRKGTVYEGGIRVPCYIRMAGLKAGAAIEQATAHIDLAPTLLELCGVKFQDARPTLDGQSLVEILRDREKRLPDRTLFFQWHRGDVPEKYRAFCARGAQYKLVQAEGAFQDAKGKQKFELFDIASDPFEERDLAAEKPVELDKLKKQYEEWFADVTRNGFTPPRIIIGNEKENPVRLSRQDWRGPKAGWGPESIGHWEVKIERAGKYKVTIWSPGEFDGYSLTVGNTGVKKDQLKERDSTSFHLDLMAGDAEVVGTVTSDKKVRGVTHVELEYVGK
jgi:hypothetical protein